MAIQRKRGQKEPPEQNYTVETLDLQDPDYMKKFEVALTRAKSAPEIYNLLTRQQGGYLIPSRFQRAQIEQWIQNPEVNRKSLQMYSEHMFKTITQYKQLAKFLSEMLVFDNYLRPTNADEEDKTSTAFKKAYKKVNEWLEDFDLKSSLPNIVQKIMIEDTQFMYLRESINGISLQEMPKEYCQIYGKIEIGYQYAFNMAYFIHYPEELENYHPDFKTYYRSFINTEEYKESVKEKRAHSYWVKLDPAKAWVFKFDDTTSESTPPLMGTFMDGFDIANYKNLLRQKSSLDVWKLIINKIPIHKDGSGKSGNKKDDLALSPGLAADFSARMEANINNPQIKVATSPLESEVVDFTQKDASNSLAGLGNSEFFGNSGFSGDLFGGTKLGATAIGNAIKVNEMFMIGLYRQFERFINYQLRQLNKRYRFKIHLEGTYFDKQERFKRYLEGAQNGTPKVLLASAMGISPQEFSDLLFMDDFLGLQEKMIPLSTSYTQTSEETGRPSSDDEDLSDAGAKTRDNDNTL